MNKIYYRAVVPLLFMVFGSASLMAQTTISGKVTDGTTKEKLAGVNVVVKGKVIGTISDVKGEFNLKLNQAPPLTLVFSFIGFRTQELEIKGGTAGEANGTATTGLEITMEEESLLGQEVVVAASRIEESILKSPVTIEKMDILAIKQSAAPDFYDALANVKGVQTASGSLNFTAVNTRGFASIANTRFVQWVDGMDTQAPLLNFPTGSIMGVSELDAESVELIPGAASALYGPNAFNGILIMNSKNPFDYQGLSAQVKAGITNSTAAGSDPMTQYGIRYAKAFNNKFAFKIGASLLQAKDWLGNDYKTDRINTASTTDLSGRPNFDGLNLYGDENQIALAALAGLPNLPTVTRTGFREQDLVDNRDARTLKLDAALHYRITDKIEVSYTYRYGGGSSIYQGAEKYALRDFNQQFHKIEFKGDNFFLRGYQSATDAGKSYNLTALGTFMNETYSPSGTEWVPSFISAFQGSVPGVGAADVNAARAFADRNRPTPGTPEFTNLVDLIKANFFQKTPTGTFSGVQDGIARVARGGASFFDNSKLNHIEGNYKFFNQIKWAEIQIGGNFRQYDLFSNGTIFNEAPSDGVNFSRVVINEFGGYAQIAKTFAEKLKITGSLRYDKNENFNGQLSPRLSAVYELDKNNNLRASFQTGFRNPDTQAQFIFFPTAGPTLLGSAEKNAGRYGVHNGGSWTQSSFTAFRNAGGTLAADGTPTGSATAIALLETANVAYVQPEQLRSFELGYKGLVFSKLLVDLNGYYTSYTNFLGSQIVAAKLPTTHQNVVSAPGRLFSLYNNSPQEIESYGVGLGLTYSLPKNFIVNGNYNWADLDAEETAEFNAGFNTPNNRFSVGIGNRKVAKNLGFNINYRWQEDFIWVSSFGNNLPAVIPSFGVLDAQVNYKVSAIKSMIKVGATNLGGGDYRTNLGSPFVGQQYYISITFDEFLN
jgi:outer membrane receptor protein involved in Fe transport